MASTVVMPIAITSAIPRSQRTKRRQSRRRMLEPSARRRPRCVPQTRISGLGARAVAQDDVVLELVELDGLGRLDVDRKVDAERREARGRLGGVVEDVQ